MAKNLIAACLGVLALSALSGCGTLANLNGGGYGKLNDGNPRVYGGVRDMGKMGWEFCFQNDSTSEHPDVVLGGLEFCVGSYLLLIETPLSAVGDTLTLPYVLYVNAHKDRPANQQTETLDEGGVRQTGAPGAPPAR